MYDIPRITIEVLSIIACIVLVRFMIKPYQLTREVRYLGLPLGFGILGISYLLSIIALTVPFYSIPVLTWPQHVTRTFAFIFLATTYYFSKKPSKNTRIFWDLTLSLLIIALIILSIFFIVTPQFELTKYQFVQWYIIRPLNIICLLYVSIHTLRSHLKKPDPTTIWIPMGFILLAISQVTLSLWYIDYNSLVFWGGLAFRLLGLAVFFIVAILTFYTPTEKKYEKDFA
jgi:hypothetical protein